MLMHQIVFVWVTNIPKKKNPTFISLREKIISLLFSIYNIIPALQRERDGIVAIAG